MGAPTGFAAAVMLESISLAARSAAFLIPSGWGAQEATLVALAAAAGLSPDNALALGLVKRAREFAIGLPGLAAWGMAERRRAGTAAGLKSMPPRSPVNFGRGIEIDARMTERHPVKALAEQPTGVRGPTVIMPRQRTAGLAICHDVRKVAALGPVTGERGPLQFGFLRRRADRDLAAAARGETVRPDPATGVVVLGEFPYRYGAGRAGSEGVGDVVVLMRSLERRDPHRLRAAIDDRRGDVG